MSTSETLRPTISVAMIATNEEKNLPRTLAALQGWVDEIIIVDSGSKDRSPQIAVEYGAKHSYNRDFRGHAEQKNIAIAQCTGDWILLLDADEVVTPELATEIQSTVATSAFNAFWIPRLNIFITRWMRHGGLFPDEKLRLFRRGMATVDESIGPHGTPQYNADKGHLRAHLEHYGYPDFANYLDHMNEYSTGTVVALSRRKSKTSSAALLFQSIANPFFGWLKNYIFRGGFLDGAEGLIFHLNHAVYAHWKYVKVWEARKHAATTAAQPRP
ncbi:glycosyltransferase family 2 protein [Terriglobus roseus]|uniref:glycosyltransferase family 2 protein n=1 Tax=Terriglobus roseus TaxID=392734 RepID=UPI0003166D90|nr:glycosyltransferase family 2 protein [Terriglobus roseus]